MNLLRGRTYLGYCIDDTADSEDSLYGAFLIIADCALRTRHLADQRDVLTTLADDGSSFSAGDDGSNMNPSTLVVWET